VVPGLSVAYIPGVGTPSSVPDVKIEQKGGVKVEQKDGVKDTEHRVKVESQGETNPSVKTDVKVMDKTPSPAVPK
jgi:hypothetical protein